LSDFSFTTGKQLKLIDIIAVQINAGHSACTGQWLPHIFYSVIIHQQLTSLSFHFLIVNLLPNKKEKLESKN